LQRALAGRLARDTAHVGFWQVVRVGGQAVWVVLIARLLGPQGYGAFVGAAGLATAAGGLTGLGLGLVMLQDVSRDPSLFADRWRKAIATSIVSGTVLVLLFGLLASMALGHAVSLIALVAIGLSELLLFPIVSIAAFAFSSRHLLGIAAALPALMAACRVMAALAFWLASPAKSLDAYVWFHTAATLLCAGGAWLWVHLRLRPQPAPFQLSRRDLGEGMSFSMVWMVGNALASLDKTLVLRLAGAEVAGLYAASYRFATVLALPVDALTMAAGPRLFRHGGGTEHQPQLIQRLLLTTLLYALVAALVLWALAGVLPWLLGPRFLPAVPAVRWMALFVPCYGLRLLGSNILMASNAKTLRAAIEGCGLGLLVIFGLLWLPHHGLLGAVTMICATEALLALATWLTIWRRQIKGQSSRGLASLRSKAR
jgi:O-antigen/teichoic acid export membrane protein